LTEVIEDQQGVISSRTQLKLKSGDFYFIHLNELPSWSRRESSETNTWNTVRRVKGLFPLYFKNQKAKIKKQISNFKSTFAFCYLIFDLLS